LESRIRDLSSYLCHRLLLRDGQWQRGLTHRWGFHLIFDIFVRRLAILPSSR